MKYVIYCSSNFAPKEILSSMIEPIIKHLRFSPDQSLKDYLVECYEEIYTLKNGKLHASREKELDFILTLSGDKLKQKICDLYNRGFEDLDDYRQLVVGKARGVTIK